MSEGTVRNEQDQGAKIIFENAEMCAQFLDGYVPIDCLKGLKAEQIEDMSSRFVTMWDNERDSDVVKRIHLNPDLAMYLITIIEHQSKVDYTMVMKLLRYMVMIWTDYEKEMERKKKGITKTKDFKYPAILPIVYFEGTTNWNVATHFADRIALNNIFAEYIPDFRYEVIRVHDYSDDEIISKRNEFSLVMFVNKLKNSEDIKKLKDLPLDYLENLQENSPRHLLEVIATVVSTFMHRINVPKDEIADFTDQILERRFPMLFDSFEAYDVQEIRRTSREEGWNEGHDTGWNEGHASTLIALVHKKILKGKSLEEIADELEETPERIQAFYDIVKSNPAKTPEEFLTIWSSQRTQE